MDDFPVLKTERLVLNYPERSDIPDIVQMLNEPDYSSHTLGLPYPYTPKDAEFWLGLAQKGLEQKDKFVFAVRLQESGKIIGGIDISLVPKHRRGEIGYWLGKNYWNQGYMTEAGKAVIRFGFEELSLKRIYASHFSTNPASGRVMQKIGMEKEGFLKAYTNKGEDYQDHVQYAIINPNL